MTWDWQQVVALICVAAALFVLGRRSWRLWKGTARPGSGCASCPVQEGSKVPLSKPLVALDLSLPTSGNHSSGGHSPARPDGSRAR